MGDFEAGPRDLSKPCDVGDEKVGEMMGRPLAKCETHDYPAWLGEDQCLMGGLSEIGDVREVSVIKEPEHGVAEECDPCPNCGACRHDACATHQGDDICYCAPTDEGGQ